jgi:CspA family cold shock protein
MILSINFEKHGAEGLEKMTGQVKRIVKGKGFGFIAEAGAPDVFFHRSSVVGTSFELLTEGAMVEFDKEPDPRDASRTRATSVRLPA